MIVTGTSSPSHTGAWGCLLILVGACSTISPPPIDPNGDARFTFEATCETLFGRPTRKTGVDESLCMPRVDCDGQQWQAPLYLEEDIDALSEWTLVEAPPGLSVGPGEIFTPKKLTRDPYRDPEENGPRPGFCSVFPLEGGAGDYVLVDYPTEQDAEDAGALITHRGGCGMCSSLQNLAAYILYPDLTDPVRSCGLTSFGDYQLSQLACIASIGFDLPCTQIWHANARHTKKVCGATCISELQSRHNEPDGQLNPCLYCDEIRSGDVFKGVAGRTRRASGLPSAICRPGDAVYPVEHYYDRRLESR